MEVRHYLTESNRDPYQEWLDGLKDIRARVAIQRRIDRLVSDNFGDHKFCRDGVWELRIDTGPGYRVYYAETGREMILLLGGIKKTQDRDIALAKKYWRSYHAQAHNVR